MSSEEIKVTVVLKKEDLKCSICLSFLNKQIFKCVNGPHYVCGTCNINTLTSCPSCRHKDKLVRALDIESTVKPHLIKCPNSDSGCKEMIFSWDKEHTEQCTYHPLKCNICNRTISSSSKSLMNHYKEFCDIQFNIINKTTLDKPRVKITFDGKPILININNRYVIFIMSDTKRECYTINVVTDNENFYNQKLKCSVDSKDGSNYVIKIPIKHMKHLNTNKGTIVPFVTNNSLLFEDPLLGTSQPQQPQLTRNTHNDDLGGLFGNTFARNNNNTSDDLNNLFTNIIGNNRSGSNPFFI